MGLAVVAAALAASVLAAPAHATIPATLYAPGACDADAAAGGTQPITPHAGFSYFFCDDGVPDFGGLVPNLTGAKAITVPAKYGGDGFTGLPAKALDAATVPGANPAGDIAIDADISLPGGAPPAGGYPLIVMMHGCCGGSKKSWESTTFDAPGEGWHYNNAWYAARGYAVVNYTARGFINNQAHGSTGETQLDSRSYEINDFQSLACQVYANAASGNFAAAAGHAVAINPAKVVVTGGSYGGGFAWLALTDPKWTCNADSGAAGTAMSLAAAAPRYGWTDLAYTLVPTGTQSESPGDLPSFDGCDTGPRDLNGAACPAPQTPVGIPKSTILGALYFSGINAGGDHTTFAPSISQAILCLQGPYPVETNPACATTLSTTLPEFMRERSAYYQNNWFDNIAADASLRVPIFNAGTFSDTLFPAYEDRRMANRILATVPTYPIKQYYGDYEHFTQNKAKEWGDTCGADHHVCTFADHTGGINADPPSLVHRGATTRLNRFIDNYAGPAGGYTGGPAADTTPDVTASLQACADNAASLGVAPNEPGPTSTASTFEQLAPNTLSADLPGVQTTLSTVAGNVHAIDAEPVGNFLGHGGACPVENPPSVAGAGVASYSTSPLAGNETMIGSAKLTVDFSTVPALPQGFQLDSRLYDVFPSGKAVLVDRGPRRVTDQEIAAGHVTYELHGNGWRFAAGHQIRVEITQDDEPWLKSSSIPSSATLTRAHLDIPVVEANSSVGGGPDPKPVPSPPAAVACGNRISGTAKSDRLTGTAAGDSISGSKGNDRIDGMGGADCIDGDAGKDKLIGGPGLDEINGGSGKDQVKARDGEADTINCGSGKDKATIDKVDTVKSCEKVKRPSGRK
jgi:dienelactone hydrolase